MTTRNPGDLQLWRSRMRIRDRAIQAAARRYTPVARAEGAAIVADVHDGIFDPVVTADTEWARVLSSTITAAMEPAFRDVTEAAKALPPDAAGFVQRHVAARVQQIGQRTRARIRRIIQDTLAAGGTAGDAAKLIDGLYKRGLGPGRALRIARTEMGMAVNAGAHFAAVAAASPMRKTWVATFDDRVRDSHARANGQQVDVGELYTVGGYGLRFPGDPDGPAHETVNCRCVERITRIRPP